jgi:hypothetical protein
MIYVVGKFYLIHAPWGFSTVWSVIKRWLDPVTVSKISILGSSYQTELLKQIPKENLPSKFGGECRCQGGCELSDAGPWQDPQWLGGARRDRIGEAAAKNEEVSDSGKEYIGNAGFEEPPTMSGQTMHAA